MQVLDNSLALICDSSGQIQEVIHNGFESLPLEGQHSLLSEVLEESSRVKGGNFLEQIYKQGMAFNWDMNVQGQDGIYCLDFTGVYIQGKLIILAAQSQGVLNDLYQELLKVNNEQTNLIREAYKKFTNQAKEFQNQQEKDSGVLQEMSALNNELTNAQRELSRKIVNLEKLNDQKNFFLGMAAHDLRNPLGSIQIYSELLQEDLKGVIKDDQARMLRSMRDLSRFMLSLVEDLLDVTKIDSGQIHLNLEQVCPEQLLQSNLDLVRRLARDKDIEIDYRVSREPPRVYLDADKFSQMITNLLTNAVKYSPSGSTVEVRLTTWKDHLVLEVQDQGEGMSQEEMDRIFRPYQTTSVKPTQGEGSVGLGLAIAKRLVEAHDGSIDVQSSKGVGTTFRISLPMNHYSESRENFPEAPSGAEAAELSGKVLVAEDESVNQMILGRYLDRLGLEYQVVDSGNRAVQAWELGDYDLMLLDVVMPGMSGLEALQYIRGREQDGSRPRMPVVIMTALQDEEQKNLYQAGADELLPKPLDLSRMQEILGKFLASGSRGE